MADGSVMRSVAKLHTKYCGGEDEEEGFFLPLCSISMLWCSCSFMAAVLEQYLGLMHQSE